MKAVKMAVRDLHGPYPDDYAAGEHDVVVLCDDGKTRYSEDSYDSKDAAEIALAGFELSGIEDLDQWGVCLATAAKELL